MQLRHSIGCVPLLTLEQLRDAESGPPVAVFVDFAPRGKIRAFPKAIPSVSYGLHPFRFVAQRDAGSRASAYARARAHSRTHGAIVDRIRAHAAPS